MKTKEDHLKKTTHFRDGHLIACRRTGTVTPYKFINEAKRASRRLPKTLTWDIRLVEGGKLHPSQMLED